KGVILEPLNRAALANPADEVPFLEQAAWLGTLWELSEKEWPGAKVAAGEALGSARRVALLDPRGTAGLRAELRLRLRFAERVESVRKEQFAAAGQLIAAILERDPAAAARLRYA